MSKTALNNLLAAITLTKHSKKKDRTHNRPTLPIVRELVVNVILYIGLGVYRKVKGYRRL